MKKRIVACLIVLAMLAGVFSACSNNAAQAPVETEKPQIQEQPQPVATPAATDVDVEKTGLGPDMLLLPTMENMADKWPGSWDNYGLLGRMMIFSRLLRLDSDLNPVYGDLAQTWEELDGGTKYIFTLKPNIKWHDGTDFSADDVAFSVKTGLKASQINGVIKGAFRNIKGAEEYIADEGKTAADEIEGIIVDGNTITFELTKPSSTFLLACAQFNIFQRKQLEGLDPVTLNTSTLYDWPIGTGPYKITEFVANDYALIEVFDDYFGEKPQIKQVKFSQMATGDYAARALANEIDFFATNDLATALAALENPNYEAFYTDIYFVRYFQWNSYGPGGNGDDPINDIRIRRAIIHAIDRQTIIDQLMPGQASLINSKVPTSFDYCNQDVYDLNYDPEKAKQLLEEAGYDFSKPLKLACYYGDQTSADFMDAVCAYLNDIGVKAEWTLITGDLTAGIYDIRDYHIIYAGLSAMAVEEAYNLYHNPTLSTSVFGKVLPKDYTGMDALIEELWVTVDQARRTEILKELQVIETEEMLWHMPLFALRNVQVFNTARVNLPSELVLSNEWSNYERYIQKWTLNPAE
ncbi:ABC transporter substrate-binding protein [Christensenellaceae bacterium OttesenSCG-928-M15]|nr:ABC transporter substrate-binding protein [Christensenellaceae bacterium OttesenSCG-928-M15]